MQWLAVLDRQLLSIDIFQGIFDSLRQSGMKLMVAGCDWQHIAVTDSTEQVAKVVFLANECSMP